MLAFCIPIVIFALFAVYFCQSNLAVGLATTYKSADVFVTVSLAGIGWAIAHFLSSVEKRFDTNEASMREVKSALREMKSLIKSLREK